MNIAICKQCGGVLEIDESGKIGVCEYCGAKTIFNDEITENITNIENLNVKEAHFHAGVSLKDLSEVCNKMADSGNIKEALRYAQTAKNEFPAQAESYYLMLKCLTFNFTIIKDCDIKAITLYLEYFHQFANKKQKEKFDKEFEPLLTETKKATEKLGQSHIEKAQKKQKSYRISKMLVWILPILAFCSLLLSLWIKVLGISFFIGLVIAWIINNSVFLPDLEEEHKEKLSNLNLIQNYYANLENLQFICGFNERYKTPH